MLPHLAEASFSQHSKEGEVAEFDLVQATGRQLGGVAVICLGDYLLPWTYLGFLHSGHKRHCV